MGETKSWHNDMLRKKWKKEIVSNKYQISSLTTDTYEVLFRLF